MNKEREQTAKMYDKFAEKYHAYRLDKRNFFNSYIDMPAVLGFLKNIKGKKILDVGCGSGMYSRVLKKRGAIVFGVDISKKLLEIAKNEVKGVDFRLADIKKLPFKKHTFDIAISTLMLDYMEDWNPAFKEIRRVLKPKGQYIFSITNPFFSCRERITLGKKECRVIGYERKTGKPIGDYFKERWRKEYMIEDWKYKFHHKTYETIINTILKNGFCIEGYSDAKPPAHAKKINLKFYKGTSKIPTFAVFKIRKK